MTDLSERAAQLAQEWRNLAKRQVANYPPNEQNAMQARVLRRCADELDALKLAEADSANLARGVALEQAAQIVGDFYDGSDPNGFALQTAVERIRSLDPDAAQALAAHDAERDKRWLDSLTNNGEGGTALTDHFKQAMAEIERRARLDEAKWWDNYPMVHSHNRNERKPEQCLACERIAALAESQPAPAKEDK